MTADATGPGPPPAVPIYQAIGQRLRQVRADLYGEAGGPKLAYTLGIPHGTWSNYEDGVVIPGATLLEFQVLTGVEALWLRYGNGPMFRGRERPAIAADGDPIHLAN